MIDSDMDNMPPHHQAPSRGPNGMIGAGPGPGPMGQPPSNKRMSMPGPLAGPNSHMDSLNDHFRDLRVDSNFGPRRREGSDSNEMFDTDRSSRPKNVGRKGDRPTSTYEGWTLSRSKLHEEDKLNWVHITRSRMHLPQEDLAKMVRKRKSKTPVLQQYKALTPAKRDHIDKLVEERKYDDNDPGAEWTCVYIDPVLKDGHRGLLASGRITMYITLILERQAKSDLSSPPRPRERELTYSGERGFSPERVKFDDRSPRFDDRNTKHSIDQSLPPLRDIPPQGPPRGPPPGDFADDFRGDAHGQRPPMPPPNRELDRMLGPQQEQLPPPPGPPQHMPPQQNPGGPPPMAPPPPQMPPHGHGPVHAPPPPPASPPPPSHGPATFHPPPKQGPAPGGAPPQGPPSRGPPPHGGPSHGPPSQGPPSHGPPSHGPPPHGPPSHGPPPHGPPSHGPPPHGPPSHGPQSHGPTPHGPPSHGPPPPAPPPPQHSPRGQSPQFRGPPDDGFHQGNPKPRPMPPKVVNWEKKRSSMAEPEYELSPGETSNEDDDSVRFDCDDGSSVTEDLFTPDEYEKDMHFGAQGGHGHRRLSRAPSQSRPSRQSHSRSRAPEVRNGYVARIDRKRSDYQGVGELIPSRSVHRPRLGRSLSVTQPPRGHPKSPFDDRDRTGYRVPPPPDCPPRSRHSLVPPLKFIGPPDDFIRENEWHRQQRNTERLHHQYGLLQEREEELQQRELDVAYREMRLGRAGRVPARAHSSAPRKRLDRFPAYEEDDFDRDRAEHDGRIRFDHRHPKYM